MFFKGIEEMIPGYRSPFRDMPDRLLKKMSKKNANGTKKALSPGEVKDLLTWLDQDQTIQGRRNFAGIFMLVTSGLRVSELCALRWKDIEYLEGNWTASFVGKGDRPALQHGDDGRAPANRQGPQP